MFGTRHATSFSGQNSLPRIGKLTHVTGRFRREDQICFAIIGQKKTKFSCCTHILLGIENAYLTHCSHARLYFLYLVRAGLPAAAGAENFVSTKTFCMPSSFFSNL